jgi:adenine-specific DNA-methyltransferase
MPRKKAASTTEKPIAQYTHDDKDRAYNPPAGLADKDTESGTRRQTYAYDPHLSPQLQWAGKAERTSFDVPIVSLHVHERIDPRTIIEAVRKKEESQQPSLFEMEELPLRQAIDFYGHRQNWSNRMIAGDSMLVMNSLLVKEGMAGQVQMIYFDPPYGIKYGSNFQPFVNKRDVKDGKDDDLTGEPETLKAFRDTWELGIHSYLTYLRDRLLLARELLHESGSIFVQISDENVHLVRNLMDEVFGVGNFVVIVTVQKTGGLTSDTLSSVADYVIQYAKDIKQLKHKNLFTERIKSGKIPASYNYVEIDGEVRSLSQEEKGSPDLIPKKAKIFQSVSLTSSHEYSKGKIPVEYNGKAFLPGNRYWSTSPEGIAKLIEKGRIVETSNSIRYKMYLDDFPVSPISNIWSDLMGADSPMYVVQTNTKVVERCLLMTTDPGDLVLDITCGSGTTAFVAEQWGRRWMTCDTSRVALTLAKQRLMAATFDYYQLAKPAEGVASGFKYKTVPHITLKSIANNEPPASETLYDQPLTDNAKMRVTGPFTVEAVPAPVVQSLGEAALTDAPANADASVARSGETMRQSDLRAELYKTGIRERGGAKLKFSRVEPLTGARFLHADGEISGDNTAPARAVVSFGPEHDALSKAQVRRAIEEADRLIPKPQFVIFAAYHFDPAAATEIDETATLYGMTLLKAQMNTDLQTADLKRNTSNESFWLVGQPDARLTDAGKDEQGRKLYQVEVVGFDYFDAKEGRIISGKSSNIAVWLLDTDYDGRSLFPRQVFFPLAADKEGWARLAKNLKAEIDEELIAAYRGKISLPFAAGENMRAAVKIVDDRGIESIKLIDLL